MKCPQCGQPAITFFKWAKGKDWLKTRCMHCGAELRANWVTILGVVLILVAAIALVVLSRQYLDPELAKSAIKYLLALPVIVLLALVLYKVGGYKQKS